MRTYKYKITEPTGRITYIRAETREEATRIFLNETAMPKEHFKRHCRIEKDFT